MPKTHTDHLKSVRIEATAPCRVDMGGTLDIKTFHLPLRRLNPCTMNVAIDLRTRVRILPGEPGRVTVRSLGFDTVTYPLEEAPYNHPLGLIFAIAAYFGIGGILIDIASASPPRSALGGSSAAAVALVAALGRLSEKVGQKPLSRRRVVQLAHAIEESVAGVPCGFQDQLAAAYGGVNVWTWQTDPSSGGFRRSVLVGKPLHRDFSRHFLAAYCGIPHESKQINRIWVDQFIAGTTRSQWSAIADLTRRFCGALKMRRYREAADLMNSETAIRRAMTPDVLDDMGVRLVESAAAAGCGGRFTGAGGGGCIWAVGEADAIESLRTAWEALLTQVPDARLLDVGVDAKGLVIEENRENPIDDIG